MSVLRHQARNVVLEHAYAEGQFVELLIGLIRSCTDVALELLLVICAFISER